MQVPFRRNFLGASLIGAATAAAAAFTAINPHRADAQSAADNKLAAVLARGHLIVGTGSDSPPYFFKGDDGNLNGLEIDLARMIAAALFNDPTKVEFVVQTADARIPNLLSDRIDITIQNLTVTPGRAQVIDFTVPYYRSAQAFLLLANGPCKNFAELKARGASTSVSALQNVFIESWIHEALPLAQVQQYQSPDAALQALNAGRADAFYIDQGQLGWEITKAPGRYLDSGFSHKAGSLACGVKPANPQWVSFLNTTFLESMHGVDYDQYAKILKQWVGANVPPPVPGYPRELVG